MMTSPTERAYAVSSVKVTEQRRVMIIPGLQLLLFGNPKGAEEEEEEEESKHQRGLILL